MRLPLLLCLALCLVSSSLSGQTLTNNTGLYVGAEWGQLRGIAAAVPPGRTGQLADYRVFNRPGASLGFYHRFWISSHLALRPMPGIVFHDNALLFGWADRADHLETVSGLSFYLPLLIEIHNLQLPTRPYAFAGPAYSYFWRQGQMSHHQLWLSNQEFAINFGIGFTLGNQRVELRPEVSFSLGLTNLLRGANEVRYLQEMGTNLRRDFLSLRLLVTKR